MIDLVIKEILEWSNEMCTIANKNGVTLNESQKEIAKAAGVKNVEHVKVMYVDSIDHPSSKLLNDFMKMHNIVLSKSAGLALGYYIFIDKQAREDILIHELRHVAQSELFDTPDEFIAINIKEMIKFGYGNGPLEKDAVSFENTFKKE